MSDLLAPSASPSSPAPEHPATFTAFFRFSGTERWRGPTTDVYSGESDFISRGSRGSAKMFCSGDCPYRTAVEEFKSCRGLRGLRAVFGNSSRKFLLKVSEHVFIRKAGAEHPRAVRRLRPLSTCPLVPNRHTRRYRHRKNLRNSRKL